MFGTAEGGRCVSSLSRVARDMFDLRNCTSFCESNEISVIVNERLSERTRCRITMVRLRVFTVGTLGPVSHWLHYISVLMT